MRLLSKAPGGLAFFTNGSVRLMLSASEAGGFSPSSSIIYYKVDTTTTLLRERGVKITDEPRMITKMPDHELWMAFLRRSRWTSASTDGRATIERRAPVSAGVRPQSWGRGHSNGQAVSA
jgi:hypothetical protein